MNYCCFLIAFLFSITCYAQDSTKYYNEKIVASLNNNDLNGSEYLFQKKLNYLQKQDNLEEYFYAHFDYFLQDPSIKRIHFLEPKKPWRNPKNNSEKIAKLHVQVNLAYHYKEFGNIGNSIKQYQKALNYFQVENIKNYDAVNYILKPLSNNYTRIGDYAKAEEILKYIIDITKKEDLVGAYTNLSILYQSTNEFRKAIKILEKANSLTLLSNDDKSRISVELAKNYYEIDELTKAIYFANKTFNYQPSLKVKQRLLILQGLIYSKQNKHSIALKPFRAVVSLTKDIYGTKNREVAKVYVLLAQTFATLNKDEFALKEYQNALNSLILFEPKSIDELPSAKALYAENTFVDIFEGIASINLKKKDKIKYIQALELANSVAKKLRNQFTSQQSKLVQQTVNRNRTNKIIEACYDLYQSNNEIKWINKAYAVMESSKSAVLHEIIQEKQNTDQKTDSLFVFKKELEKEKADLHTRIIVEQNKQESANFEQIKKWNALKTKVDTKLQTLKLELEIKHPLLVDNEQVSVAKIQETCMLDNHLFVNYFETKSHWFVFYFDNTSQLNWIKITNTTELKNQINDYINLFSSVNTFNNGIDTYKESATYLFQKFIQPLLKSNYKNITIFPDGKLNFVCFDALLLEKPNGTNFKDYPFLIKNYVLNTSFSMQVLALQKQIKSVNNEKETLGYFPVFANNERGLQTLKYTIQEKNDIEKYTNANVLIDKFATKKHFFEEVENYQNIHLSTHASAGDFYQPAVIHFIDEPLYLTEIYGLNLNNNLVVLSACETGIGKLQRGEGVMSLARGFTYAGVSNLVVSLWKVNDKSTSLLMRDFYKNKQSSSNEKALQLAKLEYLNNKSISNIKKSPYYWSGFVAIGNVEKVNGNYTYWLGFLLLFIPLGVFLYLKRK